MLKNPFTNHIKKMILMHGVFFVAVPFFFFGIFTARDALHAVDRTYVIPNLNTPIPGLALEKSPVITGEGFIAVSFLGAYIQAMYKYALSAGLVAAAVMLVYGGFLYILSPYGYSIQKAKQKMVDAIVGLVILMGTYVILVNINPHLTVFGSMKMEEVITDEEFVRNVIMAEKSGPTAPSVDSQGNVSFLTESEPETDPVRPISEGRCKAIHTVNRAAYYKYVESKLQGKYFEARAVQAAEILADCHLNLGHCGNTVATAWAAAGVGPMEALENTKKAISSNKLFMQAQAEVSHNGKRMSVSSMVECTWGRLCKAYNDCWDKHEKSMEKGLKTSASNYDIALKNGASGVCSESSNDAISKARTCLQGKNPGYPDDYVDALRPGDWAYSYAANSECDGGHSWMFLGWDEDKKTGIGWIFDGGVKQRVLIRKRCFTTKCMNKFGSYQLITRIHRPREVMLRQGIRLEYCNGKDKPNNQSICGTKIKWKWDKK